MESALTLYDQGATLAHAIKHVLANHQARQAEIASRLLRAALAMRDCSAHQLCTPINAEVVEELAALARTVAACKRCKELAASRTQTVFSDGPANADLMFVGEAPGQDEDAQGVPFVGRAGQLLTKIVTGGMLMRREDVYICNILKCRPPGNRNPNPDEAAHCREFLDRQIELVAPKVICCLGGIASRFLLDDPTPVGRMRGRWYQYRGVPVRVTYHPAYLLRNYTKDAREKVWDDVKKVTAKLRELRANPAATGGPVESDDSLF